LYIDDCKFPNKKTQKKQPYVVFLTLQNEKKFKEQINMSVGEIGERKSV
jgi:hypothetical protein